jgi:glucose-1-phosphate thymidylyltransferase
MSLRAVILARGLGTRMRKVVPAAALEEGQGQAADRGAKGMIPFAGGRPFLDWVLSGLADVGVAEVCLVVAPGADPLRAWYEGAGRPRRLALAFAVQAEPRGTADAVLAAEPFAAGEAFLALNADNLYPRAALEALGALPRAGLAGFRRSTLVSRGNIPAARILAFALLEVDPHGELTRIVEKPTDAEAARFGADPLVSMNLWRLPPTIFDSCRLVTPSLRGELELVDAVRHSMEYLDERYRVPEIAEGVLDLSERGDIPEVAARLRGVVPRP